MDVFADHALCCSGGGDSRGNGRRCRRRWGSGWRCRGWWGNGRRRRCLWGRGWNSGRGHGDVRLLLLLHGRVECRWHAAIMQITLYVQADAGDVARAPVVTYQLARFGGHRHLCGCQTGYSQCRVLFLNLLQALRPCTPGYVL